MKRNLARMSVEELVTSFVQIALAQDDARMDDRIGAYNRLYRQMDAVWAELKGRPGDQRHALLPLLQHENSQVRLKAAITLLALEPVVARQVLQAIHESREMYVALDAGMTLHNLDKGIFVPE